MAQAKLTVSHAQAQALGLLVHKKKPVYPILYEPKSGVNLRETVGTETIEVRDGADLYNLKRFQEAGYFDVVEGTVMDHLAAFSSINLNGMTLTLTFSAAITSPALTSTTNGAATDDIILKINNVATAATFAAKTNSTTITTTIDVTTEDISVQITQTGASKIKDANRSAVLPATRTFSVAPLFMDISLGGEGADLNTFLELNFTELMHTNGVAVTSTNLGEATDDMIILIDSVATICSINTAKAAAANPLVIDLGAIPLTSMSVQITATGAAKIFDTDDTAVAGVLTRTYSVSSAKAITAFAVTGQVGDTTINEGAHTIAFNVPYGTNPVTIAPTVTTSAKSAVVPASGAVTDFTNPVTYTVTAENGTTQEYTVTCTVNQNTATEITAFAFAGQPIEDSTIEDGVIYLVVANGTDPSALIATFTLSAGATATVGPVPQESGVTTNNFTSPVTYVITAEDGVTTQDWVVTVHVLSNENDFLTFGFTDADNAALSTDITGIVNVNNTVSVAVPSDTTITALIASFTISAAAQGVVIGMAPQVSGETANDFTSPVLYTVTAENGADQAWQVTVLKETANMAIALTTPAPDANNTITGGGATRTVAVGVANNTASVVLTGTKTAGQSVVVGGTDAANVTAAGTDTAPTYTVDTDAIKATGGTREFTLTVSEAGKADIVYTVTVTVAAA